MRFDPCKCPGCGDVATGVLETVSGLALLNVDADGSADYAGETDIDWDDQRTLLDDKGHATLRCPNGHQWQAAVKNEPDPSIKEPNDEP